jgi:hypothetical protein
MHHTHKKRAEAIGVTLELESNGKTCRIECQNVFTLRGDSVKETLELATVLKPFLIEQPWFEFEQDDIDYYRITCGEFTWEGNDLEDGISEALDAVPTAPEDYEGDQPDEKDEQQGSIVPRKFRDEYKARGDSTRCGDWFCETVDPYVMVVLEGKAKASVEKTYALAAANGVTKTWTNLNNGQQCMNSRNMLRSRVVKEMKLVIPASLSGGEELTLVPPEEWANKKRRQLTPPRANKE